MLDVNIINGSDFKQYYYWDNAKFIEAICVSNGHVQGIIITTFK